MDHKNVFRQFRFHHILTMWVIVRENLMNAQIITKGSAFLWWHKNNNTANNKWWHENNTANKKDKNNNTTNKKYDTIITTRKTGNDDIKLCWKPLCISGDRLKNWGLAMPWCKPSHYHGYVARRHILSIQYAKMIVTGRWEVMEKRVFSPFRVITWHFHRSTVKIH